MSKVASINKITSSCVRAVVLCPLDSTDHAFGVASNISTCRDPVDRTHHAAGHSVHEDKLIYLWAVASRDGFIHLASREFALDWLKFVNQNYTNKENAPSTTLFSTLPYKLVAEEDAHRSRPSSWLMQPLSHLRDARLRTQTRGGNDTNVNGSFTNMKDEVLALSRDN